MYRPWQNKKLPKFSNADGTPMKVLVLDGAFYGSCVTLMAEAGFVKAKTIEDSDVVVFVGGSDINPDLYGDKCLERTSFSRYRDAEEVEAYNKALGLGKVMFGICRGAQFLHAMNGGKLWQHVEGHGGPDHEIYDLETDATVTATSLHHQMLADNAGLNIIAVCTRQISRRFFADGITIDMDKAGSNHMAEMEIEAGSYSKTKCFFVQGHPEIGSPEYRSWTMTKLHELMIDWEEGSSSLELTADMEISVVEEQSVQEQVELWRAAAAM